jgi:hypothetical protein
MSWLRELLRRHPDEPPADPDAGAGHLLGMADWDGAARWPEDDTPAPDTVDPQVDLWVTLDPNRPSIGP